jgi:hypothetical protein
MNTPPVIQASLLTILKIGLLNIRYYAESKNLERCAIEANQFIVVVPRDPRLIPTEDVQLRVVGVLNRVAPRPTASQPKAPRTFNSSTLVRTLKKCLALAVPPKLVLIGGRTAWMTTTMAWDLSFTPMTRLAAPTR